MVTEMTLKEELNVLCEKIAKNNNDGRLNLAENCSFISENDILCNPREFGNSRYPYSYDGMNLWLYSSGNIFLNESTFQVFPPIYEGKQPYVAFYLGVKQEDGSYFPYSITGAGKFAFEKGVSRRCIYTPTAGYYLLDCKNGLFAVVRAFLDIQKRVCFSIWVENNGDEEKEVYISSYYNPLINYDNNEGFEDKWFKSCKVNEKGFVFDRSLNFGNGVFLHKYLGIGCSYEGDGFSVEKTTLRADYAGSKVGSITSSESLIRGSLKMRNSTMFTDTAIAGDIAKIKITPSNDCRVNYVLSVSEQNGEITRLSGLEVDSIKSQLDNNHKDFGKEFELKFNEIDTPLKDATFNPFFKMVQRQVDFCGSGKDYAGALLGVRDLFQSIEAMLLWNKEGTRKKIIEALGFCGVNGRMPRQYSIPPAKNVLPNLDLRAFIDQGNWVFDAIYQYVSITNDYSVLNEECGYYEYAEDNSIGFSNVKDSVFIHLKNIMGYLIGCIDEETNCLRAMYGDWNDALDGLGVSLDKSRRFGSGVSVMATLHLVKNLKEFAEICLKIGDEKDAEEYLKVRKKVCKGLRKFAVVEKDGQMKVLHGWGDKRSYLVGSFNDSDGEDRDSLTAHAFWVISGMLEEYPELKPHVLGSFNRLKAKYGLLTFNRYFEEGAYGVGRISLLPKGTAENGAVYNHSSLFGAWALFMMGEEEFAWDLIYKAIPLTHEKISVTPFVMNNSYVYNEEWEMDGESMSDWHTGSSNVLIKVLVRYACGVRFDLDGITVAPSKYIPAKGFKINAIVKGRQIEISFKNSDSKKRYFKVNGKERTVENGQLRLTNDELFNLDKISVLVE